MDATGAGGTLAVLFDELLGLIFEWLDPADDVLICRLVCKKWYSLLTKKDQSDDTTTNLQDQRKWKRKKSLEERKAFMASMAGKGYPITLLSWARDSCKCPMGRDTCAQAALGGHLEVLKWARGVGCPWDRATARNAAKAGHTELLKWINDNDGDLVDVVSASASRGDFEMVVWAVEEAGCALVKRDAEKAALAGHLPMLKWMKDKGCPLLHASVPARAALGGHLDVLRWLREGCEPACAWDESTCTGAAESGRLEVLQYARDGGCPIDSNACARAALAGHLHVVEWLRDSECPWNSDTCSFAALGGHTQILHWARERGCPIDESTCAMALAGTAYLPIMSAMLWEPPDGFDFTWERDFVPQNQGNFELLKELVVEGGCPCNKEVGGVAARLGRLDVLRWLLRERGRSVFEENAMEQAAISGNLEVMKWLKEETGCPLVPKVAQQAAYKGHWEILEWLRQEGCPWGRYTSADAAEKGYMDILQWLLEVGCYLDNLTWEAAASSGHIEIFKWAKSIEQEYDLMIDMSNPQLLLKAAAGGHVELCDWLYRNGCQWSDRCYHHAIRQGHLEVLKWAREKELAWNALKCEKEAFCHPHILRWANANGYHWDGSLRSEHHPRCLVM